MDEFSNVDEEKLAQVINLWYLQNKGKISTNIHFWRRNLVGTTLRKIMQENGKWRNRARGNPKKAFKQIQAKSISDW